MLCNNKNLYEILGVSETAGADEIKGAYRRLALRYHPDANGGTDTGERFKEINEAYSILGNGEKRRAYDLKRSPPHIRTYRPTQSHEAGNCCGSRGGHPAAGCRMGGLAACFRPGSGGARKAFRHPYSKYRDERGEVVDIHLTREEALQGGEKVVFIGGGASACRLRVKTQSRLSDGDFLIMKHAHPVRRGRDVYLRVRLVD